jgi:hypothetical protein
MSTHLPPSIGTIDPGPDAKFGKTENPNAAAVFGVNNGNKAEGFLAGKNPLGNTPVGAYGESESIGVFGFAKTPQAIGVAGNSVNGVGIGVQGHTSTNIGVLGSSNGPGLAGKFIGDVEVTGDIRLVNADVAEEFATSTLETVEPGTVMVLDDEGTVHPGDRAYDKRVAGVVSGAGHYRPAIILDKVEAPERRATIALVGKAFCKVDAQYGAIEVGDLLTTSETPGHAMKATDPLQAFGAVLGKALHSFSDGKGLIPILIALQ